MTSVGIKNFSQPDWSQIWAGDWSLLTCSQFGELYTTNLTLRGKLFMSKTIFFIKDGKSMCFMTQSDKDALGQHLAREATNHPSQIQETADSLKREVDITIDEGGITCHAAITARELKKPCVIGTKIATQILTDGDTVEVDADKGVIRVLQKA